MKIVSQQLTDQSIILGPGPMVRSNTTVTRSVHNIAQGRMVGTVTFMLTDSYLMRTSAAAWNTVRMNLKVF